MKIKKLVNGIGIILMASSFLFVFIFSSIVTGTPGETSSRDLLGLPIPTPPIWTSYVPYIGGFGGFVFEMFSFHGLVTMAVFATFLTLGYSLLEFGSKKK